MKIVHFRASNGQKHETEVPETWIEGEVMISKGMAFHNGRGGNTAQLSIAARVVYGMLGEGMMAADPTQALMYLIHKICQRKGAGLCKDEPS
jgi:hypothetical protein